MFTVFFILLYPAELKFNHLKKSYFVTMGTYHMAIMLLFNTVDEVPFQQIVDHTQLPEKDLIKQLQTLVEAKILLVQVSGLQSVPLS